MMVRPGNEANDNSYRKEMFDTDHRNQAAVTPLGLEAVEKAVESDMFPVSSVTQPCVYTCRTILKP